MKPLLSLLLLLTVAISSCAQPNKRSKEDNTLIVGGACEGCEAIFESKIPFDQLNETDTLPEFSETGPTLEVSGTIYQRDGKTPAAGIILYIYHTNLQGVYPQKGDEKGWGKRHGYLRGWIKTGPDGAYRFYTMKPAPYPGRKDPAHIHATIKEPGKSEYYIDEYLFADDPLLAGYPPSPDPRGGNGIVTTTVKDGRLIANRDIILGLNIPDYPAAQNASLNSGLDIGENCPAFDPLHLSGPDKGSHACPMCKYGYGQGIMIWMNHDSLQQINPFVLRLEQEMKSRGEKRLRVFLLYMNPSYKEMDGKATAALQQKIQDWGEELKLRKVMLGFVPSPVDEETAGLFRINPVVRNTAMVYKKRRIADKLVNFEYNEESIEKLLKLL